MINRVAYLSIYIYTCVYLMHNLNFILFITVYSLFVVVFVRSYDYGAVHFVSINTETDFADAPENEKGDSGIFDAGHFAPDGMYVYCTRALKSNIID